MTEYTKDQVDAQIELFVAKLDAFVKNERAENFPTLTQDIFIKIQPGTKNVRIVRVERDNTGNEFGGSVHCFIDRTNGNILKAASFKAPAPNGVRGNIFTSPNMGVGTVVSQYGCAYLRG